jgi:DNA-binding NarL/FixJ family response regulator
MTQTLIAPRTLTTPDEAGLTPREHEVLSQLASGLNNAEIAALLFVSSATIKNHVANILAKLELRNRVQAAVYACEHGLVDSYVRTTS